MAINELNINIKIRGGKRTPIEVACYGTGAGKKIITFPNDKRVSDEEICAWIQENLTVALKKIANL